MIGPSRPLVPVWSSGSEADLPQFADDIVAFYGYWRSKRRGRRMPSRADIEPTEIPLFLPGIGLVDVVADSRRFVYRLVGTREVQMRGRDPTGQAVAEGYFGPSVEESLKSFTDVVARAALRLERREFTTPDGRGGREQVILLPLSNDDQFVNMILGYTHHITT